MGVRPCIAAVLVTAIPLACVPSGREESAGLSVRDSAGVRILTAGPGSFSDTISRVPVVELGSEGDPDYEFFQVVDVVALASGNIVVANSGTYQLRFYAPSGGHLRSVGRNGDGPAEFGRLSALWVRSGDTLTVQDNRRNRLLHFDSTGTFVRGESYASDLGANSDRCPGFFPSLWGQLGDGARLVSGWECMNLEGVDGVRRTSTNLGLTRIDGYVPLGVFNVQSVWERGVPPSPREFYDLIPLGAVLRVAVHGLATLLTEGREHEIAVFDEHGRLASILREDVLAPEITHEEERAVRAERLARDYPLSDDVPFPERHGAYSRLVVSAEGDVWARRAPRPQDVDQRWVVYSPDGAAVRRVVLPDVTVHSVRNGWIYVLDVDDLGVERIVVLPVG